MSGSYKYRNGSTPDHVDSSNSDAEYENTGETIGSVGSDTTKVRADTSSDADVRKKIESRQGPPTPAGSNYRKRTADLADKAVSEGLWKNDPKSAGTYKQYQSSEKTDEDLNRLKGPANKRAELAKATADSSAAMNRLKKKS